MAISANYPHQNSSSRALAMVLALVSAIVLSPLYVDHRKSTDSQYEAWWSSSGFVLPMVVAGLIVAIKTTTSSSSNNAMQRRATNFSCPDDNAALVFSIGSSSLGLAGILIMLLFLISWQSSVQNFFWR